MLIKLNIKFINFNKQIEYHVIQQNKDILINNSSYFESLLSDKYTDSISDNICIDLTNLNCYFRSDHIDVLFEICFKVNSYEYLAINTSTCNDVIQLNTEFDATLKQDIYECDININYGLTEKIPISELYHIFILSDYFMLKFNSITTIIDYILINYYELFTINADHVQTQQLSTRIKFNIKLDIKTAIAINDFDTFLLNANIEWFKNCFIINNFLENIYYIYFSYARCNKKKLFKKIIGIIKKNINDTDQTEHYLKSEIIMPCFDYYHLLNNFAPDHFIEVKNICDKLIKVCPSDYYLYDFYDILNYTKSSIQTLDMNEYNCTERIYGNKCVKTYDEFKNLFDKFTNNIFINMSWTNVIIAGGIFRDFVNNLTPSMQQNHSKIRLYVNKNNNGTLKYLLEYFSSYTPIYVTDSYCNVIIIPSFEFDIKIIASDHDNLTDVAKDFNVSYKEIYYDGMNVYVTMDCLFGLKYGLALFKLENKQ